MSLRRRLYRWAYSSVSPSIGTISIGASWPGSWLLAGVWRVQGLLLLLLEPPRPKPNPDLITKQMLDHLDHLRHAPTQQLAAESRERDEKETAPGGV